MPLLLRDWIIQNGSFSCFKSKLNMNVLAVLKDEGYIRDYKDLQIREGISSIKIDGR